jgi:hypothetical protein
MPSAGRLLLFADSGQYNLAIKICDRRLAPYHHVAVDLLPVLLHRTHTRQVPLTGIKGNSGSKPGLPPQL